MIIFFEVLFALLFTAIFFKREKPKIYFLFLGYVFFLVALLIQLPVRLFEYYMHQTFEIPFEFLIIFPLMGIAISELTKYFSLKRFLRTRSFKNGIFFGIGWVSLESIALISLTFYTFIFSLFNLNLDASLFAGTDFALINFIFFFVFNLAVTVLIIISIIKNSKFHLMFAIILSLLVFVLLSILTGLEQLIIIILVFGYSLYMVF